MRRWSGSCASDRSIWVSADVFAYPLVPQHIHACGVVANRASQLRGVLESELRQRELSPKVSSAGLKN